MESGMIGLGRMGASMVRRLQRADHKCVVYHIHPESVDDLVTEGAIGTKSLEDFPQKRKKPRAVWMIMLGSRGRFDASLPNEFTNATAPPASGDSAFQLAPDPPAIEVKAENDGKLPAVKMTEKASSRGL